MTAAGNLEGICLEAAGITAAPHAFFPECLLHALRTIPDHALTLVSAPSGFGKTTAVRAFLRERKRAGAAVRWYTCLGETAPASWKGMAALFGQEDRGLANALLDLGLPGPESLDRIAAVMADLAPAGETYFVLDNYQLFASPVRRRLLRAFSAVRAPSCHIIVVTQPLPPEEGEGEGEGLPAGLSKKLPAGLSKKLPAGLSKNLTAAPCGEEAGMPGLPGVLAITSRELFFDAATLARYCEAEGISVTPEAVDAIDRAAGGWVAAMRLQLEAFLETGSTVRTQDLATLVERAFWNHLDDAGRRLMLALSLLDGFTARQAQIMNGEPAESSSGGETPAGNEADAPGEAPDGQGETVLPEKLAGLLGMEFFIRHVPDRQAYVMHGILREYLLARFALEPEGFRTAMNGRAARACLDSGDLYQAAVFFLAAGDYASILALPMTTQYFYDNQERDITALFERVLDTCPPDLLQEHPVALVLMAYNFFRSGSRAHYLHATDLVRSILDAKGKGQDTPEITRARGEFAILSSFTEYNDIARMGAWHSRARAYFDLLPGQSRSEVFRGTMPFGTASVLCLYWSAKGSLDRLLDLMDEYLPVYTSLASGHGAGVEHVFRAEAALARGDDMAAELMAYRAIDRAKEAGQYAVLMSADLVLAECAILRGRRDDLLAARGHLIRTALASGKRSVTRMGELCCAYMDLGLGISGQLPDWMLSTDGIRRVVFPQAFPYALISYGHALLLSGRIHELDSLTVVVEKQAEAMHSLLPKLTHFIALAAGLWREGEKEEALEYLAKALALSLPDRMYMPFARLGSLVAGPLAACTLPKGLGDPEGPGGSGGFDAAGRLRELRALYARRQRGVSLIMGAKAGVGVLTPREQEVSGLAARRLSSKEIAAQLGISVHTVNTILKSVYRKLRIGGKADLPGACAVQERTGDGRSGR